VVAVFLQAEITEGGLDPRVLAVLGVLSAVNAVLRGVSPRTGGVGLAFAPQVTKILGPGWLRVDEVPQ